MLGTVLSAPGGEDTAKFAAGTFAAFLVSVCWDSPDVAVQLVVQIFWSLVPAGAGRRDAAGRKLGPAQGGPRQGRSIGAAECRRIGNRDNHTDGTIDVFLPRSRTACGTLQTGGKTCH